MTKILKDWVHHWKFYFRWFLIGKAHCPVGSKTKKLIKTGHKALWFFITMCVTLTSAQFITWLFK